MPRAARSVAALGSASRGGRAWVFYSPVHCQTATSSAASASLEDAHEQKTARRVARASDHRALTVVSGSCVCLILWYKGVRMNFPIHGGSGFGGVRLARLPARHYFLVRRSGSFLGLRFSRKWA
jgi:hypothetical protein